MDILRERNVEFDVIEYLKDPLSREQLEGFLEMLPGPAEDLVRKDKKFKELGLDAADYTHAASVVELLLREPGLMQRPIVVQAGRALIARPSDKVLELLT